MIVKIRAKLLLVFSLILILTSAVNIYGLIQMEKLAGLTTKIYNHPLQVTRAVLTANTNIIKMHRSMKDVTLAKKPTDIKTAQNLVEKYEQEVYKQFDIVKMWILGQDGAKLIAETIQIFKEWLPIREEVILLITKGQSEKAYNITKGKGERHVALLDKQMEILKNYAANKANHMYENAQTTRNIVITTTMIALSIVLIMSIILIIFMSHNIVNSVHIINQIAHQMVAGEITATVNNRAIKEKITAYKDEMGEIGRAFYSVISYCNAVTKDIVHISQGLAEGNLHLSSKADYRGDFVQIKNALQIALSNQRQVIEDIVRVSEGLAKGTLTVVAQAKYQGDFIKIKQALETALNDLRLVIQDIVQVLQGLAEGKNITPQAEYQGDLIQIKKALEMAATKLADTTNKNKQQDWLKTGQNQLNDQMSGEQNIVELTHNIVSFLTLYLEAQVGVCYLINDASNHQQSHPLEMVASYAQTRRKNLTEEFQFSEGLVERAAKELQSILIKIEAGLEEESIPRYLLIIPFLYENIIKGVIVLGTLEIFTQVQQDFLQQVMPSIGIAVNSVESRTKMQQLLQQSQIQAAELQTQQTELQQTNEELQSQSEELQSQAEELQSQTEELQQTNDELEARTQDLERQKNDIREKNLALEHSQQAIEAKAQELELASRYKSEFLANMSHELRTPLNSLLILSQLLVDNKLANLTDKQIEYAQTIHSAGSDLLKLINDILDLSKVEAGKIEVHFEKISLTNFIENLKQKFCHVAENKGLTFHITVADDVPAIIQTDEQRLNQIVNNLLSNAFKFTHQGKIVVAFDLHPNQSNQEGLLTSLITEKHSPFLLGTDLEEEQIVISVSDTGIGIPKDKQQVIFEAFQQADGTTSRRYGGTGLGLSISRQLARLLGGDLQLHSEEGKGSTFILYLPESHSSSTKNSLLTPVSSLNNSVEYSSNSSNVIEGLSEDLLVSTDITDYPKDDRDDIQSEEQSILIIEDDRKFSKILMDLAREKHFKCLVAEDGKTGLQLAQTYKPNAIILDIGLPKMDGWRVMEQLKNNSETRHIPVHFLSAFNQSLEAKKMGALGYLVKPVNVEQLGHVFRKIEQFLARTVKNLLIIVDNEIHQQKILELMSGENIQIFSAVTIKTAFQKIQTVTFDCIILDIDIEQGAGSQLLEQMQQEQNLCQVPFIIYAERDLSPEEEGILLQCSDKIPIKSVQSVARLLDEATLFLHQVEAKLPEEKRKMLRIVHDKTAILRLKKVLIVDDDVRNTFALATILEDNEMEVISAQNGYEALEQLKIHEDIAIILMDIMMPEMDGYEAIQQIREQQRYYKLPIIALTAKAMKGDKVKCIEAGANDYLSKPVNTDKLISLMRVWLYR